MASPNPEDDENKGRATAEQRPSRQHTKVGARKTTSLSHIERVGAEICPACNEYRAQEYAHWNRQTFWQKWVTIFTGLAFAAAAYYACQAKQQVLASKEANRLTQVNALASARPWLGLTDILIANVTAGASPKITVNMRNYGRSPAIDTESRALAYYPKDEPTAEEIIRILPTAPLDKIGTMFPDEHLAGDLQTDVISKDKLDGLTNRSIKLVVVGLITYKDSLGQVLHHTWLYAMYAPDKNALAVQRRMDLPPDD